MKKILTFSFINFLTIVFLSNCNGSFGRLFDDDKTDAPQLSNSSLSFPVVDTTSVAISWQAAYDAVTPTADLTYLVIYSDSDNLTSITDCENIPATISVFGDWISYTSQVDVTGLTSGVSYYFNIIVRDSDGFFTLYQPDSVTPDDLVAPSSSSLAITDSGITTSEITLSWTEATDNYTSQSNLEYRVLTSTIGEISQISDAAAMTGSNVVSDWSSYGSGSVTATGLSSNTTYYFNVLVRDTHSPVANMAIYECTQVTTAKIDGDFHAPVLSSSSVTSSLSGSGDDPFTIDLVWTTATDPLTSDGDGVDTTNTADSALEYKVVASFAPITGSDDAETLTNFNAASVLTDVDGDGWETDINTLEGISVADGSTTYFLLAVKDEVGNISFYDECSYTPASVKSTLVCYHKLDGSLVDSSGNSWAGTLVGSLTYGTDTPSGIGNALDFTGNDNNAMSEYISSSAFSSLYDQISISMWIKVDAFTNSYEQLVSKGLCGLRIQRYATTNKIAFMTFYNSTGTSYSRIVSQTDVADGKWHHIVCMFASGGSDGNEKIYMYVDGIKQDVTFGSDGNCYNGSSLTMGSSPLRIGYNENTTNFSGQEYTGMLDDFRVYHTILSEEEIAALDR